MDVRNEIRVLDPQTVGKIAAGEVIERPLSVVKELVENAIDAGSTAITVEIRDGGISLIRVTDNGCGIPAGEVRLAFTEHATSKIRSLDDLSRISSLGFRGEALSSIASVSRVELITKEKDALTGVRYVAEGGKELALEEVGAPQGTTFLVRDLFYNIPARRKFMKSARTEGSAILSLMEHLALSHDGISFQVISEGRSALQTGGNSNPKDVIYHLYGRDIAENLLYVEKDYGHLVMRGFIGKPNVSRGNRNFENYFVNGRFIKSPLISKSIEDAYHSFLMLHQYPFTALTIEIDGQEVDVNVHPQKMELKFQDPETIYEEVYGALRQVLEQKELIPEVQAPAPAPAKESPREGSLIQAETPIPKPQSRPQPLPEPFETGRRMVENPTIEEEINSEDNKEGKNSDAAYEEELPKITKENQLSLNLEYEEEAKPKFKILGQVFRTYWIVEQEERLLLVDQHAAHEKVIFERLMQRKRQKEVCSQTLSPGFVLTLSPTEQTALADHKELFLEAGYEIEDFGGNSVEITAVPADIYGLEEKQYFLELLDELATLHKKNETDELYLRIATMSCKAAIKGNQDLSVAEFESLMEQLFACENPYQCPHGRPTMISMTRYDLERKFKRIV